MNWIKKLFSTKPRVNRVNLMQQDCDAMTAKYATPETEKAMRLGFWHGVESFNHRVNGQEPPAPASHAAPQKL